MQIDSTNSKVLLLGDIHQDINRLHRIIDQEAPDITVTTGDWFDSFVYDSDNHVRAAASYLYTGVHDPRFVTCIGNHDCHYLWTHRGLRCSGYEDRKDDIIHDELGAELGNVRDKMQWFVWVDDFLVSHAGVASSKISPLQSLEKDKFDAWLTQQAKDCNGCLACRAEHWFVHAGYARSGNYPIGGLTWQDFDNEFEPIEGLKQIVGHTPHRSILPPVQFGGLNILESPNLDIDCHLNEYLVITNKKLEIKKFYSL